MARGARTSTAEETAYAIQALWFWNENVAKVPKSALRQGARWLTEHFDQPYPPLWIKSASTTPAW